MSDTSIHPRVAGGRTKFGKVNVRKTPSAERRQRVVTSIKEHLARHPRDSVRASQLAKIEKAA